MKKELVKKGLAFAVILLFIYMYIAPSLAVDNVKKPSMPVSNGNILYVGGTGTNNYTRIQDAIDNASDGDTVFVYDDSSPYYEHNITIRKSISLIGEDKNTTIIDGEGTGKVVWIQDDNDGVTISGFTIQKCGPYDYKLPYAGIYVKSSYNTIYDNIIINNDIGIICLDEENGENYYNILNGNTIKNSKFGIIMVESFDYKIFDNYISKNEFGIYFTPFEIPTVGVSCSSYGKGRVYRNNFTNNNCGIYQYDWGGDDIYENNIINNGFGIEMFNGYGCGGYNNVFNNSIMKNRLGIRIYAYCGGSTNSTIYQNNIIRNWIGIHISNTDGGADDNKIYQNNFIGNLFFNARDWCKNQWDNGINGNYWDNYIGLKFPRLFDRNDDGIGGLFYIICPFFKGNKDRFPLMEPIDISIGD
jgi:nitrous oxidase accessory protein